MMAVYWEQKAGRVRWFLPAEPGAVVTLTVQGQAEWRFSRNTRGRTEERTETEEGRATVQLRVVR